nr:TatD family hydrolase [Candidatus Saccharibacteria bacterium]
MLIDTHAHLHFAKNFPDLEEVLTQAEIAGITHIINVGVNPADSRQAMRLARKKDTPVALFATAGLHPHEAGQGDEALDLIHDMAEDVVAIGECGLDYYKNHATKTEQDRALRGQIKIALE